MSRTKAQKAADEGMEQAVSRLLAAYGYTGLPIGWVLATPVTDANEDGETDSMCWFQRPGQHWVHTIGIVEALKARLTDVFRGTVEEEDEDDDA